MPPPQAFRPALPERTLLVVDPSGEVADTLEEEARGTGRNVVILRAYSADEALAAVRGGGIDLVVTDGSTDGPSAVLFLAELLRRAPGVPRVFVASSREDAALARVNGRAAQVFLAPFDARESWRAVEALLSAPSVALPFTPP